MRAFLDKQKPMIHNRQTCTMLCASTVLCTVLKEVLQEWKIILPGNSDLHKGMKNTEMASM